jgi:hypothetical protein
MLIIGSCFLIGVYNKPINILTLLNSISSPVDKENDLYFKISFKDNNKITYNADFYCKDGVVKYDFKNQNLSDQTKKNIIKNFNLLNIEAEISRLLKFYEVYQTNKNSISFIDKTGHQKYKSVDVFKNSSDKIKIFFDSENEVMETELSIKKIKTDYRISKMKIKKYSQNSVFMENYKIDFHEDDYLIERIKKNVKIIIFNSGASANSYDRQVAEIIEIGNLVRNKGKALSFFIGQKNI